MPSGKDSEPEAQWVMVSVHFMGRTAPLDTIAATLDGLTAFDDSYRRDSDDRDPLVVDARRGSVTLLLVIPALLKAGEWTITRTETGKLLDKILSERIGEWWARRHSGHPRTRRRTVRRTQPKIRVDVPDAPPSPRDVDIEGVKYRIAGELHANVFEEEFLPDSKKKKVF